MDSKRILFIGDSLTEFFDWQTRFPDHEVVNLGVAGETVEGLLFRAGEIIVRFSSPDLIFLMTGINNIAMEDLDFLDSYGKIVERLSAAYPGAHLFVQSILPVLLPWIGDESVPAVNRSLKELADEKGAEYLDVYRFFVGADGRAVKEYLLPDGVHLSDKGYTVWAKAVESLVDET